MNGIVSLVGAGPGDPGLLTRAALARLRRADLVLFDALVSPSVVALARRARRFPVGKRAGRPSMRQDAIHALMIRAARRGQRVVRLKGGDPFVFGRGGEEALALRAAGVRFEVIPGVSSAIAAPALSGIPVTHRGVASAFTVIAGHAPGSYEPVLDGITLVFSASREDADTWSGTLESLASGDGTLQGERPGLIVVGDVVAVAAHLSVRAGASAFDAPATRAEAIR